MPNYITVSKQILLSGTASLDYFYGPWKSINEALTEYPYEDDFGDINRSLGKVLALYTYNGQVLAENPPSGSEPDGVIEYCFKNGLTDNDFEPKESGGGGLPEGMKVVTFNPNTGTGYQEPMLSTTNNVTLPECRFSKEDYIFNGWSVNAVAGEGISPNTTVGLSVDSTVYYALWESIVPPSPMKLILNDTGFQTRVYYYDEEEHDWIETQDLQFYAGTKVKVNFTLNNNMAIDKNIDFLPSTLEFESKTVTDINDVTIIFTMPNSDVTITPHKIDLNEDYVELRMSCTNCTFEGYETEVPESMKQDVMNNLYYIQIGDGNNIKLTFEASEGYYLDDASFDGETSGQSGEWQENVDGSWSLLFKPNYDNENVINIPVTAKQIKPESITLENCIFISYASDEIQDTETFTNAETWCEAVTGSEYGVITEYGLSLSYKGDDTYMTDKSIGITPAKFGGTSGATLLLPYDCNYKVTKIIYQLETGAPEFDANDITVHEFPDQDYIAYYVVYGNGDTTPDSVEYELTEISE